jgi:hypothetical protein
LAIENRYFDIEYNTQSIKQSYISVEIKGMLLTNQNILNSLQDR